MQVGTESPITEPKTSQSATGKGQLDLPGSKSVACEERAVRNLGDPVHARRTNCESQAGRPPQRQEVTVQREPGVRLPRSSSEQPSTEKADASQGGNRTSRSAKETGAVRKTEHHRPTYLRAKAKRDVLKSPVLENCTPGSVRGPPGNGRPYLDLFASSRLPRHRVQDAYKQRPCGAFSVARSAIKRCLSLQDKHRISLRDKGLDRFLGYSWESNPNEAGPQTGKAEWVLFYSVGD